MNIRVKYYISLKTMRHCLHFMEKQRFTEILTLIGPNL